MRWPTRTGWPSYGAPPTTRPNAPVRDQIADLEETLAQLSADHYQLKLISREEFLHNRSNRLTHRLDAAKASLATTTRRRPADVLAGVANIRKEWEGLGRDRQRALIGLVVESVTINPGTRGANAFDAARVVPNWR